MVVITNWLMLRNIHCSNGCCLIRNRNCLPVTRIWVDPWFLGVFFQFSASLICLSSFCILRPMLPLSVDCSFQNGPPVFSYGLFNTHKVLKCTQSMIVAFFSQTISNYILTYLFKYMLNINVKPKFGSVGDVLLIIIIILSFFHFLP